jgi:AraC-like DNA-binding protein
VVTVSAGSRDRRRRLSGLTVSVVSLKPLLGLASARGLNTVALLGELGLQLSDLDDIDRRISEFDKERLWHEAASQANDAEFGLHVAQFAPVGAFDVLDYSLCYSATLGDAIGRILQFHRVLSDVFAFDLKMRGGIAHLRRTMETPERHSVEALCALIVLRARGITAQHIAPRFVRFSHARPANTECYTALFSCPVYFDCTATELAFESADLTLPTSRADAGLVAVLDRHMQDLLERLPCTDEFVQAVYRAVAHALRGGRPTLAATARAMRSSPRTIQRHLRDRGTSHRGVVDDVRRELAERLVGASRHSLTEIAFLVGFAELSGFQRTFRRWTGLSPFEFRVAKR